MHKISVCNLDLKNPYNTLGLPELLKFLINSGKFEVSYHDNRIGTGKGERGTLLYCNDKKIYIDFWDYAMPTHTNAVFNYDLNLIIKLQHPNITFDRFIASCNKKSVFLDKTNDQKLSFFNKIIPWTFFCSKMMRKFIDKEDLIEKNPDKQLAFFCGKSWKCRGSIINKLKSSGIEIIYSDQGGINALKGKFSAGKVLTDEEYLEKMKSSKYGLVLHGRGSFLSEAKNRREIDYMMLKKPLLLNYKPNYYNPLIEGKHYIYIDEKTDFNKLESMYNINEIAMNGYQWYKDNASSYGVVNSFLKIIEEKL